MWFIKIENWDEFQDIMSKIQHDNPLAKALLKIKEAQRFCKQGKGISFYNRKTINKRLLSEINRYSNNPNYHTVNMNDIKEP